MSEVRSGQGVLFGALSAGINLKRKKSMFEAVNAIWL